MDWTEAIQQAVLDTRDSLGYGTGDCLQFVRTYVRLMTGVDHGADIAYDSEMGAMRALADAGGIEEMITRYLGAPEVREPEPGDIAFVHVGNEHSAGVVSDGFVFCLHHEKGFVKAALNSVMEVWPCRSQ